MTFKYPDDLARALCMDRHPYARPLPCATHILLASRLWGIVQEVGLHDLRAVARLVGLPIVDGATDANRDRLIAEAAEIIGELAEHAQAGSSLLAAEQWCGEAGVDVPEGLLVALSDYGARMDEDRAAGDILGLGSPA